MSEDDVATFLTRQTMIDSIVLTTDTGSYHDLQCNNIYLRQIASWNICSFKTNPYFTSGRDVSQDKAPFSDASSMIFACNSQTSLLILHALN